MKGLWCLCFCLSAAAYPSAASEDSQMTAEQVLDTRKEVDILDSFISYLDTGDSGNGDNTIVFIHGNPTAAYLWRNIIPYVSPMARCLAPDLIGFGRSGKLEDLTYEFADQYRYLSAWMDAMDLPDKVTVVVHDWGSGVGLRWCNEHRDRVQAIVFMESMIGVPATWDVIPGEEKSFLQALRTDAGEDMILVQNIFIEGVLLSNIIRNLTDEEKAEYRRPFLEEGDSRRPMLISQSFPVAAIGPEDVVDAVNAYRTWMASTTDLPKLYIDADPGFLSPLIRPAIVGWPNLRTVEVKAKHFMQEDVPGEIGEAMADFLDGVYKAEAAAKVLDTRKEVDILDSFISYLDTGDSGKGDNTIVFIHGNPTASYLWRNIIPYVSPMARCLAPDLIGFGRSGKLEDLTYEFADQYRYLSAWMDAMDLPDKVTVVVHDWGSGVGLRWCNEHRDRVQAIVFMESMIGVPATWDVIPGEEKSFLQALRTDAGEDMILVQNIFIEGVLLSNIIRNLTDEEKAEYRRPFLEEGDSRRPMLISRSFPVAAIGPEDVVDAVNAYRTWMASTTDLPKLYIDADPGFLSPLIRPAIVGWPNLRTVEVKAKHFMQEDVPDEIGEAMADFLDDRVYVSSGTVINHSLPLGCILVLLKLAF